MSCVPDTRRLRYVTPPRGMPTELLILGQRWTVHYAEDGQLREYGWCIPKNQMIVLDAGQGRDALEDTLLHEVLHAILDVLGCKKGNRHRFIDRCAPGLLEFLRHNRPWWRA